MNFFNAPGLLHYISGKFSGLTSIDILNSPYSGVWMRGVYSQGQFIIPGSDTYIARSADGHNWSYEPVLPTSSQYFISDCGNGVLFGAPYTSVADAKSIISYNNGQSWELAGTLPPLTAGLGQSWSDTATDKNGVCIVVISDPNAVARSIDNGLTWSVINIGLSGLTRVVYGNGLWMAINGVYQYRLSTDGVTWSATYSFPKQLSNQSSLSGDTLIHTGDKFVYMAFDGTGAHSVDGVVWTVFVGPYSGGSHYKLAYEDGVTFMTWNNTSAAATNVGYWTTDYVTWNTCVLPITGVWHFVVGGGSRFVAVTPAPYGVSNVAVIQ